MSNSSLILQIPFLQICQIVILEPSLRLIASALNAFFSISLMIMLKIAILATFSTFSWKL